MFERIKNIFRRLFEKQKLLEEPIIETKIKTNNFKEELSKSTEIYNIQRMYEEGKVAEDELQISQIKKLINLYKEQINMLDRDIITKRSYKKESI